MAHNGLAVQPDRDEVLHRLDVVFLELVPGRLDFITLRRSQVAVIRQILDPGLDVGPQATQLAGSGHERASIGGVSGLQSPGIE